MITAAKTAILTPTHVILSPRSGGVTAVTSLGDDMFVTRFNRQQVEVYDAATLSFQRCLVVLGLSTRTSGLAACSKSKCLYVSDHDNDCVHRVDLGGNNAVKKWSVARRSGDVSVNGEHNLIVACCLPSKLQEYTTHGSLVREIYLQADVTSPWHAIQLSTGDYVVSQCTSPGAVSVVGVDGQVVRTYEESQTSGVGEMKYPASLAVTKNDNVLVADTGNRILSINSSLGSIQELPLSVDGGIEGLCLDESRGRLYVAYWSGDLQVFAFDEVRA